MLNDVATHCRLVRGACLWSPTMKSHRIISALESLFVFGLVVSLTLVGFQSLSTVISRSVQPLAAVVLVPEEPTLFALAEDESQPTTNR